MQKTRHAYIGLPLLIVLLVWTAVSHAQRSDKDRLVSAIGTVGMTVSDMDRSIDFYSKVLSFEKISDDEHLGRGLDLLQGLQGTRLRVVRMRLGDETIQLNQYLSPVGGRPIPKDSRSHDLWFQHIAVIVSNMNPAYQRLQSNGVRHVSTGPQTIPPSNTAAAGIVAFKFQDPDGHNLELLYFPPGKGDPKWQEATGRLFLGIDHTAIAIGDTDSSLAFYRDLLGLKVVGESLNTGIEQERLDNVTGAKVRITGLRAGDGTPGIEFLEYLSPLDSRSTPPDQKPNDLWNWQTQLVVQNTRRAARLVRKAGYRTLSSNVARFPNRAVGFVSGIVALDPDGHNLVLVEK